MTKATVRERDVPSSTPQTEQQVGTRDVAADQVDRWLAIGEDGRVTVYSGKVELGTGVATALAQIVADELRVPLDRIEMVMGDTARTPDQGYTAGSKTIQLAGAILQRAAAAARRIILERAADRLAVPAERLVLAGGVVRLDGAAGTAIAYEALIGDGFGCAFDPDGAVPAVPPPAAVVGQSIPRIDLPGKLTGGASFVHDLRLPGMLHGRVVRPWLRTPSGVGATVERVEASSVAGLPGLVAVVRDGDFVGVVAEREEQAVLAAERLVIEWTPQEPLPVQDGLFDLLRDLPVIETRTVMDDGDIERRLARADRTLAATYAIPVQAHASIGPSCAVADVQPDGATIYAATQGVFPLRDALAGLLDMAPEAIHVVFREGPGCYGHNGADDVAADAALLSRAVGRPVRVQWSRQDEFAWEPKGPAMLIDVRAGLDRDGAVVAWDYAVRTPTHTSRPRGQAANLLAGQLVDPPAPPVVHGRAGGDRNAAHVYTFGPNRVLVHWLEMVALRTSSLRSLGGWANTTATESFMDELAAAAGTDPVAFRLRHLRDPRAIEVIERAAAAAGWTMRPAVPGKPARRSGTLTGRGVAFARYESRFAYVAAVAEVAVELGSGEVRVTRVVVAHDCGRIINPDGVRNQVEGNVIQGVSRALKEEVTWDDHAVTSLTWETYPILTFPEVPAIEIDLIDRPDEPPWGAGEPAICVVGAAIGNAIHDATGARLRTLPFTPARVQAALG